MSIAFVFPGQGSQAVGMGKELADEFASAREIFEKVDEALGEKLSQLIFEGPQEDLTLTQNTQPALMAVSLAASAALEEAGLDLTKTAKFVAGHSLGEYSAIAAVGGISVQDTAKLLRLRGKSMQEAVPVGEGAMAALLGLDFADATEVAQQAAHETNLVCQAANDNAPGQVVVSGAAGAVEKAIEIAKSKGAKRAMLLPVSAPFHCAMMAPAADIMADALAHANIRDLDVPVVSNVLARDIKDPSEIRLRLADQVTGTVRWRESIGFLAANGVTDIVEVGAGKVLSGLNRRIDKSLNSHNVGAPQDVRALVEKFS